MPSEIITFSTLEVLFEKEKLRDIFNNEILKKSNSGIDRISASEFAANLDSSLELIKKKILDGSYKFSPYTEKLIIKGRNKFPRVISIPTIRDRIVIDILKKYLQEVFCDSVSHDLPNVFIKKIKEHIDSQRRPIFYYKTDISSFFDSLDHNILYNKLQSKIEDVEILKLIANVIETPTVQANSLKGNREKFNSKGVPQGLSISNILADIYMSDFDRIMNSKPFFYKRYVDDIFILSNILNKYRLVKKNLKKIKLKNNFEKTSYGILNNTSIEYLGYSISDEKISIKDQNVQKFINRIAKKCTKFKSGYLRKEERPIYLIDDNNKYKEAFIFDLNLMIGGAIGYNKRYGWICYFSQMNDKELLFRLDSIISSFFKKMDAFNNTRPQELKTLVRSYHLINSKNAHKYLYNFDSLSTISEKSTFLRRFGHIDPDKQYSDNQIELIYAKIKQKGISILESDIGSTS